MSLCLNTLPVHSVSSANDFLGLETELMPELKGHQKFSPQKLHQDTSWNVEESQVEVDSTQPLRGQSYSLIPWDTQNPEDFLSIKNWIIDRGLKDKTSDWKVRLRNNRHAELVGKVLQCRGLCEVYRGTMKARVQHLSQIKEGDEFVTGPDSIAWVYLMDGTLVRIAPSTNLSFLEINWSPKEVMHVARVHQGNIYWHIRDLADYKMDTNPETDAISLPLLVREANQGFFEREIFTKQNEFERAAEALRLEDTAIVAQVKMLNEMKAKNNSTQTMSTKVMMVAPNGSVLARNTSFDLFHYPGGKSYFKKRYHREEHEFNIELRGYSGDTLKSISDYDWNEIAPNGRSYTKVENVTGQFDITELITKRVKTIELAREIWFDKFTTPVMSDLLKPKELAINHGYTIWDKEKDYDLRFQFLVEYTRRMETTNLKSMENLLTKVGDGAFSQKDISDTHYVASLNYYLRNLKTRYTDKNMQVREMNDLQYYIWILRNGKTKN